MGNESLKQRGGLTHLPCVDSLRPVFRWLALIALVGLVVQSLAGGRGGPPAGSAAPDIRAPLLGANAPFELSAYRGKTIVLDFWATWCPPCQRTLPALQTLHERYAGTDVAIYSVNTDDGRDRAGAISRFVNERGYRFPVILDDGAISRDYRVEAIPTLVVIRPDGLVEEAHVGLLHQDANAIAESIGEMIEAARKAGPGA
jgi:thiol-disulfide isomerase/thioredoxin